MSPKSGNHALIFGASGITGWAIVNQLLSNYPAPNTFSRVTALTNRPLPKDATLWPEDERLRVISGIDLLQGTQQDLERSLQQSVADVETVTQIYFYAYKFDSNPDVESKTNMDMLSRSVKAIESLSSRLSFVVLPTGTKAYGVHLLTEFPFSDQLPLKESLPHIPEPYASQMFYYYEVEALSELAKGKKWTWCELRPDIIVGYVPNNNVYCLAQTLGVYLSLYASIEGPGAQCPFPGNLGSWKALFNHCSQDMVARLSIFASLRPAEAGGRIFNVADSTAEASWSTRWPIICRWFGLHGVGPTDNSPQPSAYIQRHIEEWKALAQKHGLRKGVLDIEVGEGKAGYQHFLMTSFDFDRQLDLSKVRELGFKDSVEDEKGWLIAFERLRKGKAIP